VSPYKVDLRAFSEACDTLLRFAPMLVALTPKGQQFTISGRSL